MLTWNYVNFRIGAENQAVKAKSLSEEAPVSKDKLADDEVENNDLWWCCQDVRKPVDFKLVSKEILDWPME